MATDPAPSGESALEEQGKPNGRLIARLIVARDEISDLRAEVARLTAGWEAEVHRAGELRTALDEAGVAVQRVNGRLVALPTRTTARLIAAEAEAARYREALEEIASWTVITRASGVARRALLTTEGGDRAD